MKNWKLTKFYYLLAFFIPVILFTIVFILKEITPFGRNTLLSGDMMGQYVHFYSELSDRLKSGGSFLYSFRRGLGFDYLCESGYYYISPLNIILIFFNNKTMPVAMSILLILKCGFAGLNMSIYLKKHFSVRYGFSRYYGLAMLMFASSYALCSYMVNYYGNIIWIDCFVMFPLIILSLERLIHNDKPYLYSIYLGIAILTNYYIGFMICIFCAIYFIYLIIISHLDCNITHTFFRFAGYSVLAGCLCATLLIPEIHALSCSSASNQGFYDNIDIYYPAAVSFFRFMMSANPTFWHHPYLYSTCLVFLLLPVYFFYNKVPLKERIGKAVLFIFMLLSFQLNILDYLWNGLHKVNCFAGRQSFVLIFIVLTMCTESVLIMLSSPHKMKRSLIYCSYFGTLILFLYLNMYFNYTSTFVCIVKNIIIITIYLMILAICKSSKKSVVILSALLSCELLYSAYDRIDIGIEYTAYKTGIAKSETAVDTIKDSSFFRIKNDIKISKNDGSANKYNSLSTYSSMANDNITKFLTKIGYFTCLNAYSDVSWEPVFGNIFCEKYIVSQYDYLESDTLKLINAINDTYIFQNKDALSIAFEVENSVTDASTFKGNNPFEVINSFADKISGCGNVYDKINIKELINNHTVAIKPGTDLYLYCGNILEENSFQTENRIETLYPKTVSSTPSFNPSDYIFHVATSHHGGTFYLEEDYNPDEIVAYSLNIAAYHKLMDTLSANQMKIDTFFDTHIIGTVSASYDGTMMTSIPFDKGWSVRIDGKKVKTAPIENALLSFPISTGNHIIEMKYLPYGLTVGCSISLISFCLLLISIFYFKREKHHEIQ